MRRKKRRTLCAVCRKEAPFCDCVRLPPRLSAVRRQALNLTLDLEGLAGVGPLEVFTEVLREQAVEALAGFALEPSTPWYRWGDGKWRCYTRRIQMPEKSSEGYVVLVNTDLMEGRGGLRVLAVTKMEATARRLAKGADVQGSDGRVRQVPIYRTQVGDLGSGGEIFDYGPVTLDQGTVGDVNEEDRWARRREAEKKARAAGLTDEDLAMLAGG